MTKKCIAARRRYKAKKTGAPTRRKRPTGTRRRKRPTGTRRKRRGAGTLGEWFARGRVTKGPIMTGLGGQFIQNGRVFKSQPKRSFGLGIKHRYVIQGKKRYPLKKRAMSMGSGLRKKRRGRGKGPRGAGFWEDLGKSFEWVGNAALTALPFIAAVL